MTFKGATLAGRILGAVLGIVIVTMAIGLGLYVSLARRVADVHAEQRAADIAASVADVPGMSTAVQQQGDPRGVIRQVAARVVSDTGASYVVVIDARGTRLSHPNPALVGKRVEEPVVALDGHTHTGVDNGSLGRSANARVPVRDQAGRPVGEVSVGILETQVTAQLNHQLGVIALYTVAALAVGVAASLVLARAIKRVTFGLEPDEIVALVQEREAMLHGIREGVIAFDRHGRMNVLNDEGRRLLGLTGARLGQALDDLLPAGRLREILGGAVTGPDQVAVTDEYLLVLNRRPVAVAGRSTGWVVTIRDRTELEALLRQLDSVEGVTAALRAQEHEFANRLHALAVLLELGEAEEAARYAGQLRSETIVTHGEVRSRVAPAVLAALLLAKMTVGAERGVIVELTPSSQLGNPERDQTALLTVLGNLVDNAIDAAADGPVVGSGEQLRRVTVELRETGHEVFLAVSDTGPGIPPDRLEHVFTDGFSTKQPRGGLRRGVGLALVHRLVLRAGGSIDVVSAQGTRFEVHLPVREVVST